MNSPRNWQGSAVLITGGASGMGVAVAGRFAAAGARLTLADVDAGRLAAAADRLKALAIVADVARPADCARMVDGAVARFGRLDLLVNSAGVWVEGPAESMTDAARSIVMPPMPTMGLAHAAPSAAARRTKSRPTTGCAGPFIDV